MRISWFDTLRSFFYSVLLHVVVALLLVVSFEFSIAPPPAPNQDVEIIQALSVDERAVEQELERLRQAEQQKREQEQKRQAELEKQVEEARKQREAEEKRLADLKKQQDEEQNRLAEAKKKQEELAQQRKLEEEKKRRAEAEAERRRQEAEEAERKRKEAEAEAERKRQEAEEAERRRQEDARRREAEQALKEQIAREEVALAEERRRAQLTEIQKYTALINKAVSREFNRTGLPEGLSCELLVRMVPGGEVTSVTIGRSSGNAVFDRRAELAVKKASPLPVPQDPGLFELMRETKFIFTPE
jgi:colicin import membrane protein